MPGNHIPPIPHIAATLVNLNAGETHKVKLSNLPKQYQGRPLHAASILMRIAGTYDADGAGAAGAVPGHIVPTCIRSLNVQSAQHQWVHNLDGDEVNFLATRRYGTDAVNVATAIDNNAVLADQAFECEVRVQFADRPRDPDAEPDGCVPAGLLDETEGTGNEFSFTVPSAFFGVTGVTIKKLTSVVVEVELLPLDHLRGGLTPHRMRAYTERESDFTVKIDGRAHFVGIRDRKTAAGAIEDVPTHQGYTGLELTIGDQVIYTGRDAADIARWWNMQAPLGADTLNTAAPEFLPIVASQPGTKRSRLASGKVRFVISGREDAAQTELTSSRILIHETGRSDSQKSHAFAMNLGAPRSASDPTKAAVHHQTRFLNKDGRSTKHPINDILDQAVYWPGMSGKGYTVPDRKFARGLRAFRLKAGS